jgi:hypothetical protein
MRKFSIVAITQQSHPIGTVEARNAASAIKKAEKMYADELKAAAARCPKTGQLYDIYAHDDGSLPQGDVSR